MLLNGGSMKGTISACLMAALCAVTSASAQPAPKPAAPAAKPAAGTAPATRSGTSIVVFPHVHLHVKDVAASKKFWIDTLGGSPVTVGGAGVEAVRFPDVLIFLEQKDAAGGGSKGTVVDHVAFDVKDLKATVDRLKTAKATLVTRAETNPVYVVTDEMAYMPDQATSSAVVMAPGDMKVELVEVKTLAVPVAFRHIHFAPPMVTPMKDWYIANLGAKLGTRGFGFEGLDLAGKSNLLMFTLAGDKVSPTDGHVNNRIGFEVRGLALLVKKLEKAGAKVVRAYGKSATGPGMSAVVTDPWGTTIELTEGLTKLK
jgi:catechol 2,3-dioxygenase-like lactoylglutathione lyase family enzyme